jgi:hypothetical protein
MDHSKRNLLYILKLASNYNILATGQKPISYNVRK